ncbi:MAG TPA: hypothetical protein VF283_04660 [Bryobacteraceae bacterium]
MRFITMPDLLQDDWKATKDLTLNLGVRYDYFGTPAERYDRYSNFNPTVINSLTGLPGVVQFANAEFGRSVLHPNHLDFAPRFGFAWDVFGKNKMVVRGGYGIFYYSGPATMILGPTMGFQSTTTYTSQTQFPAFQLSQGVPFINPPAGASGGAATFLGGSPSFLEPNRPTPYAQQWNFGLQYSLPLQSVLEITYAGNHTVHAPAQSYNLNQLAPQYLGLGFGLQNQVANPFQDLGIFGNTISLQQSLLGFPTYNSVTDSNPDYGSAIYHSVLARFQKRTGHGLTFMASFTGSKLIGDIGHRYDAWVSSGEDANCNPDPLYNRRVCRSIEPLDIPELLTVSTTYELPFGKGKSMLRSGFLSTVLGGWQTNAIFQAREGNPVVVTGASNNASSIPNYLTNAALSSSRRSASEWFDTAAFANPPLFTYGNSPRTLPNVRNPGYKSLDFSLIRNIRFTERFNLQLRAEAFNIFNWVSLGNPDANFLDSTFGQITSSQPGRILQFGAHLSW